MTTGSFHDATFDSNAMSSGVDMFKFVSAVVERVLRHRIPNFPNKG